MRRRIGEAGWITTAAYVIVATACATHNQPSEPAPVAAARPTAAPPRAPLAVKDAGAEVRNDAVADAEVLVEDHAPPPPPVASPTPPKPHPLDGLTEAEMVAKLRADEAALGSISLGATNAGGLIGGVQMQSEPGWTAVNPGQSWGTRETIDSLKRAIAAVLAKHPNTPALRIGDISAKNGGPLSPHRSHQSGRDVDLGYYYLGKSTWYRRATRANLDVARTWTLVKALITTTDVEMILIDVSIQRLLREHAEQLGEDATWLDLVFKGRGRQPPMIRHVRGHATHLHVRFYSPIAQNSARLAYAALIKTGRIRPALAFIKHRARRGDTLAKLAKRYGVTMKAIKTANKMHRNLIREKRVYLIPKKGGPPPPPRAVAVPPRLLPPPAAPRTDGRSSPVKTAP